MRRNVFEALVVAVLAAATALGGCRGVAGEAAPAAALAPSEGVLATVNGKPIREEDVRLALARTGVKDTPTAQRRRAVLETLVRRELIAQRAAALGLDRDPRYLAKVRDAQAQVDLVRREELGDLFEVREVVDKAVVTDAEAKAWYEDHRTELASEVQVWQILRRDEAGIAAVKAELDRGRPFEEVAAEPYRGHAVADERPWDLGYLRWSQLPEPWRAVVPTLEPGATSDTIQGPNGRWWILRIVDRRVRADASFEAEKAAIVEAMRKDRVEARRAEIERELRDGADVVFSEDPTPPPPPEG